MVAKFLYLALCIYLVNSKYVHKKSCADVDPIKCNIHNVKLDPCSGQSGYCDIKREEPYTIAFDFTTEFDARELTVALLSDPDNSTRFSTTVTPLHNGCEYTKCPIDKNSRNVFELDFEYYMKSQGKFPMQMRLWHHEDESDICCFIFDVNVLP